MMLIKKKKYVYNDHESLNEIKLFDRLEYLNKLVRSCIFSNKLVLTIKDV